MDLPDLLSDSVLEWCKDNSEEADHQFNIDCIFLLPLPGLVISKYEPPCPLMRHTPATTNSNRPLAAGDSGHKNVCIPKKTQQDTEYCVRLWEKWCQHRQSNIWDSIPQLTELQPTELLTSFWSYTKRWFWVFPRHSKPHFLWPNAPSAMENSTCYQPL